MTDAPGVQSSTRVRVGQMLVDPSFYEFVEQQLLPAIDLDSAHFWSGTEAILGDLSPLNQELLDVRDAMQAQIDDWHRQHAGQDWDHAAYVNFLREIGYIVPGGEPFTIATRNVDAEIAAVAGPQLVVPVNNARFAINAANARWGSLYDALYGTDVIDDDDGKAAGQVYNPIRGEAVIAYATRLLDRVLPLQGASHQQVRSYRVTPVADKLECRVILDNDQVANLADPAQFIGCNETGPQQRLLFAHNGLHFEVVIDPNGRIGREARGAIDDIVLESALTTIQDCEDSVAAVDAGEKVGVYRNWLGLMLNTLEVTFTKGDRSMTRRLAPDRVYTTPDGDELRLSGRSVMLVRNVGHLMRTDCILDANGEETFEGLLDAIVTSAAAVANQRQQSHLPNSRFGSIYIVKPKMHGPAEAQLTNILFGRVEDLLGLERNTIKVGVMDEERRTTVNLPECIRAVSERLVFINTGFLDRTGDEIHTSMYAGPVLPKEEIKQQPWIAAYEDWNVDVGIRCGLPGRAQIGKGMWPKPDEMAEMMATKQGHPLAGANCAWVPSPTAATLHAMHYHEVDVRERQQQLATRDIASLDDILTPPLGDSLKLDAQAIQRELDNNAQGILGYV
ncbi:MAG: malate synthase G, partial [Gammaproteobacteria bacterium]|nr:malate synthase G [Gammaproteobacteria bacterium]